MTGGMVAMAYQQHMLCVMKVTAARWRSGRPVCASSRCETGPGGAGGTQGGGRAAQPHPDDGRRAARDRDQAGRPAAQHAHRLGAKAGQGARGRHGDAQGLVLARVWASLP